MAEGLLIAGGACLAVLAGLSVMLVLCGLVFDWMHDGTAYFWDEMRGVFSSDK